MAQGASPLPLSSKRRETSKMSSLLHSGID